MAARESLDIVHDYLQGLVLWYTGPTGSGKTDMLYHLFSRSTIAKQHPLFFYCHTEDYIEKNFTESHSPYSLRDKLIPIQTPEDILVNYNNMKPDCVFIDNAHLLHAGLVPLVNEITASRANVGLAFPNYTSKGESLTPIGLIIDYTESLLGVCRECNGNATITQEYLERDGRIKYFPVCKQDWTPEPRAARS